MSGTPPRGRTRLDAVLVRRGLARSRDHAAELIAAGRVRIDGRTAAKAATDTPDEAVVEVMGDGPEYVSRGGHKLVGALEELKIDVDGLICLDAGACTGGFTDVLLRAGAKQVIAVDVGHDQLAPAIRQHPDVRAYDGVNVRDLTADQVGGEVDLLVADLSFISLRLVLPALDG